jgi:UDP-N-acetylmuramyl tripeptide synthase
VIAGKGHETGQITRDGVLPFDDRLVARALLEERAGAAR